MKLEKAIFACGCFWGAQHQFERAKGVIRSEVGYIGGDKENPTYQEVKAHTTGHAEATLVEFDAEQTTYTDLCKLFFEIHDPAQTDGQGPDIGPQYRSEIFYLNEAQKQQAEAVIALLREKGITCLAAALYQSQPLSAAKAGYPGGVCVVIGSEGQGLTDETIAACNSTVRIPMTDRVESLNAGIAGSILLWHFREESL